MMKLSREQIIQALEYCTGIKSIDACANCPACLGCNDCVDFLREESLALIKELTDSEDYWKRQTFDACMDKGRLDDKIKELTEENERLRFISAHVCVGDVITSEQMEELRMAHTLPGMHGDPVGPVGMAWVESYDEVKAETVRKMQERLKNYLREVADGEIGYSWIDQIAKEMLEENK